MVKVLVLSVVLLMLCGCNYRLPPPDSFYQSLPFTYGKIIKVTYVYVDDNYKSGTIIDDIQGQAIEFTIKLNGTNELIVIATNPPDEVMITDCIKIFYQEKIEKLEKVHGNYCIHIE